MAQSLLPARSGPPRAAPQKDVYMKPLHRTLQAAAMATICCCIATTVAFPQSDTAKPNSDPRSNSAQIGSKDETNSSPRERGRILVKRNPIASEYQVFGDMGTAPGADADGEAVDFRAFFPRTNPVNNPSNSLEIGYSLNFNDQSSIGKSGYSFKVRKVLDNDERLVVAAQLRNSSSDRLIEHYESVWQTRNLDGNYYLDRPRLSFDDILTQNTVATGQIGFQASDRHKIYFKTYHQKYSDNSYRNRIELQFARADLVEGSEAISEDGSATSATFSNARTRRYFGDTDNNRTRQHNTFGGSYAGDVWSIDYAIYSQKWNLDRIWYNWNFREGGLDVRYEIEDPYKPNFVEGDGTDLLDQSKANLSSVRIHNSYTRDRDLAARLDAERRLGLGERELWIQTGFLHREKDRASWEDRQVYFPSSENPLPLSEVAFSRQGIPILDGTYALPSGLDPALGRSAIATMPEHFVANTFREEVESAPQSYDAAEKVTSGYLLALQELGNWTIEAGGRFERTQTSTRGRVIIPEAVNVEGEGEFLYTLEDPSNEELLIVKDLYSENSYENFIPSAEITFEPDKENTFKAAWFQLLMRPQYFNIVDYRRISVPTRNISEGNPNLQPTSIDKFRLAWTRKSEQLGSLSIEAYMINIDDFFYGSVSEETILENGEPVIYRVGRVENGESAKIKGVELQWKKTVSDFLVFEKASATLAYTYSDSEAFVQSRPDDTLPTPERSEHLLKLGLTGSVGKLSNSLSFTYQSEALDDLGPSYDRDEYREPVIGLSYNGNYSLGDKTTLGLSLANLTDHPERSYEGSPTRVSRNQFSSWFATFSLTQKF